MSSPRVRVLASPGHAAELDLSEHACVVIDVLRATTTMAYALSAGARAVLPVGEVTDARDTAKRFEPSEVLLCGERQGLPPDGFDLGNSPSEMTPDRVAGKTLVLTTTNGTRAIEALARAQECVAGGFVNAQAVTEFCRPFAEITIVCAGTNRWFSREDFLAAGDLAGRLERSLQATLDDGARTARELFEFHRPNLTQVIRESDHGRVTLELGFERDLTLALAHDSLEVVPRREGTLWRASGADESTG